MVVVVQVAVLELRGCEGHGAVRRDLGPARVAVGAAHGLDVRQRRRVPEQVGDPPLDRGVAHALVGLDDHGDGVAGLPGREPLAQQAQRARPDSPGTSRSWL